MKKYILIPVLLLLIFSAFSVEPDYFKNGANVKVMLIFEGDTTYGIMPDTIGLSTINGKYFIPSVEFVKQLVASGGGGTVVMDSNFISAEIKTLKSDSITFDGVNYIKGVNTSDEFSIGTVRLDSLLAINDTIWLSDNSYLLTRNDTVFLADITGEKYLAQIGSGGGSSYTFNNGLTESSGTVSLGDLNLGENIKFSSSGLYGVDFGRYNINPIKYFNVWALDSLYLITSQSAGLRITDDLVSLKLNSNTALTGFSISSDELNILDGSGNGLKVIDGNLSLTTNANSGFYTDYDGDVTIKQNNNAIISTDNDDNNMTIGSGTINKLLFQDSENTTPVELSDLIGGGSTPDSTFISATIGALMVDSTSYDNGVTWIKGTNTSDSLSIGTILTENIIAEGQPLYFKDSENTTPVKLSDLIGGGSSNDSTLTSSTSSVSLVGNTFGGSGTNAKHDSVFTSYINFYGGNENNGISIYEGSIDVSVNTEESEEVYYNVGVNSSIKSAGYHVSVEEDGLSTFSISLNSYTYNTKEDTLYANGEKGSTANTAKFKNFMAKNNIKAGGQITPGSYTITPSATPVFNCNNGNIQQMSVTANVTSWTITNAVAGGSYKLYLKQDATGGRTIANATGATKTKYSLPFVTTANADNIINIEVKPDGTIYWSIVEQVY